ncbi:MAG: septal ring lytic transglycosylase RlpA family protein [Cycloclasticus sp.]|nr:septal ring lytic transglycosylase RlpA family protein [Cycloclasticus sp.]
MRACILSVIFIGLLSSCGSRLILTHDDGAPPLHPANIEATPDAIPRVEAKSRGGNPVSYEVFGKRYAVLNSSANFVQRGTASWYGTKFHGNKTSNGEVYDMYKMTAAHKTLPIPTYVEVRHLNTNKKIIVRINDRGPFHGDRIIDLSYAAAAKLGTLKNGTSSVEIRAIDPRQQPQLTLPNNTLNHITAPSYSSGIVNISNPVYIQVAAFKSLANANALKTKLIAKLPIRTDVSVKTYSDSLNSFHRVYVGPFKDRDQAKHSQHQLQGLGFLDIRYRHH